MCVLGVNLVCRLFDSLLSCTCRCGMWRTQWGFLSGSKFVCGVQGEIGVPVSDLLCGKMAL